MSGQDLTLFNNIDFEEIEKRLLVSMDVPAVNDSSIGSDVYTVKASEIFCVPHNEVTEEQRKYAKWAMYRRIYGAVKMPTKDKQD